MRALQIVYFMVCINLAAPLILSTTIFAAGPAGGTSDFTTWAYISIALVAGGVSILGFSFKVPAVISVFAGIYFAALGATDVLIYQILSPSSVDLAYQMIAVFSTLGIIIGAIAILQWAGGQAGGGV